MPSRSRLVFALTTLAIALLIGIAALLLARGGGPGGIGTALVGGPFALTDQTGKRVSDADFRGKYMLIFFGYTYCPDVCPTELQVMSAALDQLGGAAARIQPIFITIDPERDTPDVMKAYVANFHPRLIGLTGSAAEIAAVAKAYRVYYGRSKGYETATDYLMDHSAVVYLMGPDGKYVTHSTYSTDAKAMADDLRNAIGS